MEAVQRSNENRAMPVQLPCSLRKFRTEIVRRSCGSVQRLRGDSAVTVRGPDDRHTIFFRLDDHLKSCDFHKTSARPPATRCSYDMSRGESVRKSYGRRLPPHG